MSSTTSEIELKSTRELKRLERDASKKLRQIRTVPPPRTEEARDGVIAEARRVRAERDAAAAELARRATEPRVSSLDERFRGHHKRVADRKARAEAQRAEERAQRAELKREADARNERERERKRAAGLLYEPTDPGGGDVVAALFSSRVLRDCAEFKIQADGYSDRILTARHIIALWWIANLIAEHGGESVTFAAGTAPHWPDKGGEVAFREADLAHLINNQFVEVERQAGTVTYGFGSRTKAIAESYRERAA